MVRKLEVAMMDWESGCPERIHHFLKVRDFCMLIGNMEHVGAEMLAELEILGLTHDIGIKPALEKYQSAAGPYQEKEGEVCARTLLETLGGYDPEVIDRVCKVIGRHHTYTDVDGIDCQILLEADFLVNSYENHMGLEEIKSFEKKVFRTESGKQLLHLQYSY